MKIQSASVLAHPFVFATLSRKSTEIMKLACKNIVYGNLYFVPGYIFQGKAMFLRYSILVFWSFLFLSLLDADPSRFRFSLP